ncbi:tyrosinase family protein [Sphingomonas parva]|nr:tyrosinase family protein [Sphingomonas parva]
MARLWLGVAAVGLSAAIGYGGTAQTPAKKIGPVAVDPAIKAKLPPGLLLVRTRKSINALSAAELASLRRGFAQMIAWNSAPRDSADFRRSLKFWANIHAYFGAHCRDVSGLSNAGMSGLSAQSDSNPTETATWCTCKHGSNQFLTWHRMYLYYFEQVLRQASGDSSLTLPYWDYEADAHIPAAYRAATWVDGGTTKPNPLFVANRQAELNAGTAAIDPDLVDPSGAMAQTSYLPFNSAIEGTPHGNVHCATGVAGCPTGYMGSVPAAGNDPIFYSHHANIDRLYECWLQGDLAARLPTGAPTTASYSFVNGSGAQVTRTASDMLTTQQLAYRYTAGGGCPIRFHLPPIVWQEVPWRRIPILGPTPVERGITRAPIRLPAEMRAQIVGTAANPPTRQATLVLEGLRFDEIPRVMFKVALQGKDGKQATVGVINFFNETAPPHRDTNDMAGMAAPDERRFEATAALRALGGEEGQLVLIPTTGLAGGNAQAAVQTMSPRTNLRIGGARIELR